MSIWVRHSSHRLLVFGEYEGTYWSSLLKTYATYSSSIVLSMVTNHLLVSFLGLTHRTAWIVTMLWTGIYNYLLLRTTWGNKSGNTNASSAIAGGGDVQESEAFIEKQNVV